MCSGSWLEPRIIFSVQQELSSKHYARWIQWVLVVRKKQDEPLKIYPTAKQFRRLVQRKTMFSRNGHCERVTDMVQTRPWAARRPPLQRLLAQRRWTGVSEFRPRLSTFRDDLTPEFWRLDHHIFSIFKSRFKKHSFCRNLWNLHVLNTCAPFRNSHSGAIVVLICVHSCDFAYCTSFDSFLNVRNDVTSLYIMLSTYLFQMSALFDRMQNE